MARALVAVGVPLGRAYELAKRIEADLSERGEEGTDLVRVEELAVDVVGEAEGAEGGRGWGGPRARGPCAAGGPFASCTSWTCRSSSWSAAPPAPASRRLQPKPP